MVEKQYRFRFSAVNFESDFKYSFPSHLLIFYSLVQLPTVKLNGVSQPTSIEYKMVHGFNQCSLSWIRSVFSYVLEQVSNVH